MDTKPLLSAEPANCASKDAMFEQQLLHTLAAERQSIHELGERMFVVGMILGFAVGAATIGSWSFLQL